jgi:dihydrofolate reductase
MTEIIVIAAVAKNGVIGKDGKIPWYISEDFKHFKKLTMGHPCIMGENTYYSLPIKPLPGRENIVLSFNKELKIPGAIVKNSFEDALEHCKNKDKVFICGGASVYKLGVKVADRLELTRIHRDYEGDVYFPEVDFNKWKLAKRIDKDFYSFLTYVRK